MYQTGGEIALKVVNRSKPIPKNRVEAHIEEAVVQLAVDQPALGQRFPPAHYEKLKEYVRTRAVIGDHQVLYVMDVTSSELLIFTLISFDDFDVGMLVLPELKFLIRHDRDAQRLTAYSALYFTTVPLKTLPLIPEQSLPLFRAKPYH